MRLLVSIVLFSSVLVGSPVAADDSSGIVVVVHARNAISKLSRSQVIDIYMGRLTGFPDGSVALPFDLPPDSPIREAYYQTLIGKSIAQVNAYWARLLFTGRASPPRPLSSERDVLKAVAKNKDAIGYVEEQTVKEGSGNVKIVYRLKDAP